VRKAVPHIWVRKINFSPAKTNVMNKGDLVNLIADKAGVTKAQAGDALDAILGGIQKTLSKGGRVTLVGFGTFSVTKRAARKGRNPRTGKEIKIKAKNVVRFKAGKQLSEKV
jgi:DNA-binding protein HU-beta